VAIGSRLIIRGSLIKVWRLNAINDPLII